MKSKGVFITGTDTGAGKTVVSAVLLALLRRDGIDAVPMKPVQSGCVRRGGDLVPPDLEFCLNAAGYRPDEKEMALMCRYKFEHACSPHLAARKAGVDISQDLIAEDCDSLRGSHDAAIVEGAGGVMAPLSREATMCDLMRRLALPVILVARAGLGTINHSLMSLKVLKDTGLDVAGVIFNKIAPDDPEYIVQDNILAVQERGGSPVLGCLRYAGADGSGWRECMKDLMPAVDMIKKRILQ